METSKPNFKLIFALGNNDPQYKNTYHNVGFLMADCLKDSGLRIITNPGYMNEAGKHLKKAMKGVKPDCLLVIQDDSDITLGNFKLSFGRSSGGHKGAENIIQTLKTKNFWRLRIGIRPSPSVALAKGGRRLKASEFVLKKISSVDQKILNKVFQEVVENFGK
ncbi:MAG: hypothetical protein Q8P76_00355 [bacterium]|nr:hypothetical protein [bacterium]